ncbi:MAG: hypothetical protein ACTTIX_08755 [Peptoanaerobacter stomatis]
MIRRFEKVCGNYVEMIYGQKRLGYSISDTVGFYDMFELQKEGERQGSDIIFYDYENGKVYEPFEKEKNVIYDKPIYVKGAYYFLKGDFNKNIMTLFKYLPEDLPEKITELNIGDINLYNLKIIGDEVYIISEDEYIVSYYPKRFQFPLEPNECVLLIDNDKVFIEAWIEEGWDDEKHCATDEYKYYHKLIVKDFFGNLLYEEIGSLDQNPDGNWWIS